MASAGTVTGLTANHLQHLGQRKQGRIRTADFRAGVFRCYMAGQAVKIELLWKIVYKPI